MGAKRINCSFSEQLLAEVDRAAERLGMTRSAFFAESARRMVEGMVEAQAAPVPCSAPPTEEAELMVLESLIRRAAKRAAEKAVEEALVTLARTGIEALVEIVKWRVAERIEPSKKGEPPAEAEPEPAPKNRRRRLRDRDQ